MYVVRRADVAPDGTYERSMQHFFGVGKHAGAHELTMTYGTLKPAARTRAHYHLKSDLALYILAGRAKMVTYDENYSRREALLEADTFCFVPRGQIHVMENMSEEEPVVVIACYNHAGSGRDTGKVFVEPELESLAKVG